MPKQKKNHSEELYEWLNVKFHPVEMLNLDGEATSDWDQVTTFVFSYQDPKGVQENITVSLTDDDRKLDADVVSKVTVEYDQDMANQLNTDFSKFLAALKDWARSRMLGFQVTNLEAEPGKRTMQESKFSTLSGTVKTSVQTLEGIKIILKHTDVINDDVRGARTRRIHRIYVENTQGERFLMPFTSLRGARAMARHVVQGGNPYDATGTGVSNAVAEAVSLSKFLRRTLSKQYEDITAVGMIESARHRLAEVKKMLNGLSGVKGYARYSSTIAEQTEIEFNPEVKNHFVRNQYDEQLDHSLPHAWRAYQMSNLKEFDEFAQWTDRVVNEVDNPGVQQVQQLMGQAPEKPNQPKAEVKLDSKGKVAIELDKNDKQGATQVAKLMGSGGASRLPPGTSVTVKEGQMPQFEVTFEKHGKTVVRTIPAVSLESAEIQAYHMADATDSEIVGDVRPMSEGLGGDQADDLINDVKVPGQGMYEADLAEADMEEGNEFTGARREAIKAGQKHFTVSGKTYSVTGDSSDEKSMTEGIAGNWQGKLEQALYTLGLLGSAGASASMWGKVEGSWFATVGVLLLMAVPAVFGDAPGQMGVMGKYGNKGRDMSRGKDVHGRIIGTHLDEGMMDHIKNLLVPKLIKLLGADAEKIASAVKQAAGGDLTPSKENAIKVVKALGIDKMAAGDSSDEKSMTEGIAGNWQGKLEQALYTLGLLGSAGASASMWGKVEGSWFATVGVLLLMAVPAVFGDAPGQMGVMGKYGNKGRDMSRGKDVHGRIIGTHLDEGMMDHIKNLLVPKLIKLLGADAEKIASAVKQAAGGDLTPSKENAIKVVKALGIDKMAAGDSSDEKSMTEGLARILYLSGVQK